MKFLVSRVCSCIGQNDGCGSQFIGARRWRRSPLPVRWRKRRINRIAKSRLCRLNTTIRRIHAGRGEANLGIAIRECILPNRRRFRWRWKLAGCVARGPAPVRDERTFAELSPLAVAELPAESGVARYGTDCANGLLGAGVFPAVFWPPEGVSTRLRPSNRPLMTSGKFLPKMANSGTLMSTISMTNARIAMAVDDCIGLAAPSEPYDPRRRWRALVARHFQVGSADGEGDNNGRRKAGQCQLTTRAR